MFLERNFSSFKNGNRFDLKCCLGFCRKFWENFNLNIADQMLKRICGLSSKRKIVDQILREKFVDQIKK